MHDDGPEGQRLDPADAPILLAILMAARTTGVRLLETIARRELQERHRIKVRFLGGPATAEMPHGK